MIPGIIEYDWQTTAQGLANQAVTVFTTGGAIFANATLNIVMYYIRVGCLLAIAIGAFVYLTQLNRRWGEKVVKDGITLLIIAFILPYAIVYILPMFPPIPTIPVP